MEAPCGIHCGMCFLYLAGNDEAFRSLVADLICLPAEKAVCPGCRSAGGFCPVIRGQCGTYLCAKGRGIARCSACTEFPCRRLVPHAETLRSTAAVYHGLQSLPVKRQG